MYLNNFVCEIKVNTTPVTRKVPAKYIFVRPEYIIWNRESMLNILNILYYITLFCIRLSA